MSDDDLVIELTEKYEHAKDRIARALVLVEGLRREHADDCIRDGLDETDRRLCCEEADHNARVDAAVATLRGDAPRRPCFMTYQRNGRGDYRTCGREYGHTGDHGDVTGKDTP